MLATLGTRFKVRASLHLARAAIARHPRPTWRAGAEAGEGRIAPSHARVCTCMGADACAWPQPMWWYDANPSGRTMSRSTLDQQVVDFAVAFDQDNFFQTLSASLAALGLSEAEVSRALAGCAGVRVLAASLHAKAAALNPGQRGEPAV